MSSSSIPWRPSHTAVLQHHPPHSSMTSPSSNTGLSTQSHRSEVYHIIAGKMFDSYTRTLIPNQVITVDKNEGIILDVQDYSIFVTAPGKLSEDNAEIIDLSHLTVLPGFVDTHVHCKHPALFVNCD